jgi:hypothetical protein
MSEKGTGKMEPDADKYRDALAALASKNEKGET